MCSRGLCMLCLQDPSAHRQARARTMERTDDTGNSSRLHRRSLGDSTVVVVPTNECVVLTLFRLVSTRTIRFQDRIPPNHGNVPNQPLGACLCAGALQTGYQRCFISFPVCERAVISVRWDTTWRRHRRITSATRCWRLSVSVQHMVEDRD